MIITGKYQIKRTLYSPSLSNTVDTSNRTLALLLQVKHAVLSALVTVKIHDHIYVPLSIQARSGDLIGSVNIFHIYYAGVTANGSNRRS